MNKTGLKVLLVDDDHDLLQSMSDLFQLFHFVVSTAANGVEAWAILQKQEFDIVLSDIRMSEMDGLELLENIKNRNPNSPKVVIASAFSDYSIEELYEKGADAFFHKPFDASAVREFLWQSVMKHENRWQIKPHQQEAHHFQGEFESLEEAQKSGSFSLGRLGFFYHLKNKFPKIGDWISFNIHLKNEPGIPNISGSGKVRWVRKSKGSEFKAGIGVEFKYLDDESLKPVTKWIAAQKNAINIPRK